MRVLVFAVSSAVRKKSSRQKILTKKVFPAKIYSTVDILMLNINYGIESDTDDEEEYCLEEENATDNPVDNASSGNEVTVDPSPEQSVTPGIDVIVLE